IENDEPAAPRENLANAVGEYRQALQSDPQHYWAQFQLGRCLLAQDHNSEAVEALGACIALRPDSPWAYTIRGLANALAGHNVDATRDLDRALQLSPDFQPARLNRGVAYLLANDTTSALADFDAALAARADKRLCEAAFYRGQILLSKQRAREALEDFS